eukprot:scaffold10787_cov123-Isochrysis_galbana.AAC.5
MAPSCYGGLYGVLLGLRISARPGPPSSGAPPDVVAPIGPRGAGSSGSSQQASLAFQRARPVGRPHSGLAPPSSGLKVARHAARPAASTRSCELTTTVLPEEVARIVLGTAGVPASR